MIEPPAKIPSEFEPSFLRFHDLMKFRVHDVLLVSTLYDGFVLEEDGQLSERIFTEFVDLKIHNVPRIHRASSAKEAFESLVSGDYDFVITMSRISDMDPIDFCQKVKESYPDTPVVMLSYERLSSEMLTVIRENRYIDRIFYWSGDSKILLAIIKHVEDIKNLEADCQQGVQVILVVDDSAWYYSQFLPIIYTELMRQTSYLVSHAVNEKHRLLRVRARPKILLAETYEEAMAIINQYGHYLLGVISDVSFPKDGKMDPNAGLALAGYLRDRIPDLSFLLQSENEENETKARELDVPFLNKNSQNLLLDLRNFILESYGFGVFVFRYPDGTVIAKAATIEDFEETVRFLPAASVIYHSSRNHFSKWFRARTEFEIAEELRRKCTKVTDDPEIARKYVLDALDRFYTRYQFGVILDFGLSKMDMDNSVTRIGDGSLGGKARGIAFFNAILNQSGISRKHPEISIKTPRSFVVCSEVFESFMESNSLYETAIETEDEERITREFLAAELPEKIIQNLRVLLAHAEYPLAVRSSSILEDSQVLPFAGIYKTFILPNNHPDTGVRLKQLMDSIRLIYASVFYNSPKQYARNADLRIEEERMAILIQRLVGESHQDNFYPAISGVAQSYNYYAYSHMKPEDGTASLALGFGRTIVEGGNVRRFSPAHPALNQPYSSVAESIKMTQNTFYALDLTANSGQLGMDEGCNYRRLGLSVAERDGVLGHIASTYSPRDDCLYDSVDHPGPKVITFAGILKYDLLPIAPVVKELLEMGRLSFGSDVEIEFAVNIPQHRNEQVEFYFLQVRPMVVGREMIDLKPANYAKDALLCSSSHTIGNGVFNDLMDIIYVDPDKFKLQDTTAIAAEIGELNKILYHENRRCVLMGFGRMGTADPWLGIPLAWHHMSQAKVVIEADRDALQVEPSLGSHFYHNLTSLKMGYLHIGTGSPEDEYIDWQWLKDMEPVAATEHVRLVRSPAPLVVKIDGRNNTGVILKPDCSGGP